MNESTNAVLFNDENRRSHHVEKVYSSKDCLHIPSHFFVQLVSNLVDFLFEIGFLVQNAIKLIVSAFLNSMIVFGWM